MANGVKKSSSGSQLGPCQSEVIWFAGMDRDCSLERFKKKKKSAYLAHEPQQGLEGGSGGQLDDLTCRANALSQPHNRRGGRGVLPHSRKTFNGQGFCHRVSLGDRSRLGWGSPGPILLTWERSALTSTLPHKMSSLLYPDSPRAKENGLKYSSSLPQSHPILTISNCPHPRVYANNRSKQMAQIYK